MTSTYTPLANITLTGSDSEVLFSNIPSTSRDLILVCEATASANTDIRLNFNGVTTDYSRIFGYGTGSSAISGGDATAGFGYVGTSSALSIIQIMEYSVTNKHKTILSRTNQASSYGVAMFSGRWARTNAISSISVFPASGSFSIGSTFALYGVIA